MKVELREIYLNGIRWNIAYDDDYANGWRLERRSAESAIGTVMQGLKYSPLTHQRKQYKEWRAKREADTIKRRATVQKVLDAIAFIETRDWLEAGVPTENIQDEYEEPLCEACGSANLESIEAVGLVCKDCAAREEE